MRKKIPLVVAIALVYCLLLSFFIFILVFIYPHLVDEVQYLKEIDFQKVTSLEFLLRYFNLDLSYLDEVRNAFSELLIMGSNYITDNFVNFLSLLTTIMLDIFLIPFILFFLLKDDQIIYSGFSHLFPKDYKEKIHCFLVDVDKTLVLFINGRMIVAAIIAGLLLVSFLIIGINFSYILALISFAFFIIPSVGWILASLLPVMVGFSMSFSMGIEVVVVMLAAATLEGFWLTPEILGISLTIHPLMIIFLLLCSGYFFGLAGLIFITPAYALLKVIVIHLYRFFYPDVLDG